MKLEDLVFWAAKAERPQRLAAPKDNPAVFRKLRRWIFMRGELLFSFIRWRGSFHWRHERIQVLLEVAIAAAVRCRLAAVGRIMGF